MRNIIVAAVLLFTGCVTGNDEAASALSKSGFTDIHTRGTSIFACGEHDKYGREFTAKNVQGQVVEGVVCCGVWKNCTVRF